MFPGESGRGRREGEEAAGQRDPMVGGGGDTGARSTSQSLSHSEAEEHKRRVPVCVQGGEWSVKYTEAKG